MTTNSIDTEILIAEVQSRPCLWDINCSGYKNRESKPAAWMEVAERMGYGFAEMGEHDKALWIDKVQRRWKATRDAFIRRLRQCRNGMDKKKTKYIYEDQLKFLEKVLEKSSEVNLGISEETGSGEDDEEASQEEARAYSLATLESPKVILPPKKSVDLKKKQDTTTPFEEELISLLKESNHKEDNNGDRSFLLSLLPLIESCNLEQKLKFRMDVMQLIMKMKNIKPNVTPPPAPPTQYQLVPVPSGHPLPLANPSLPTYIMTGPNTFVPISSNSERCSSPPSIDLKRKHC